MINTFSYSLLVMYNPETKDLRLIMSGKPEDSMDRVNDKLIGCQSFDIRRNEDKCCQFQNLKRLGVFS